MAKIFAIRRSPFSAPSMVAVSGHRIMRIVNRIGFMVDLLSERCPGVKGLLVCLLEAVLEIVPKCRLIG